MIARTAIRSTIRSAARPIIKAAIDEFIVAAPLVMKLAGNMVKGVASELIMNGPIRRTYTNYRWKISVKHTHVRRRMRKIWHRISLWMVGLFAPSLARSYEERRPPALRIYGRYHIVGLRYHDGVAKTGDRLELRREYNNQYDLNAIRAYCNGKGVGYIARHQAKFLASIMDMGNRVYGNVLGRDDQYRMLIEVLHDPYRK